jgi:hypothetical protein
MRELRNKSNPPTLIPWETQAQAISESFLRVVGASHPLHSLGSTRWEETNNSGFLTSRTSGCSPCGTASRAPRLSDVACGVGWDRVCGARCRLQRHSNFGGDGVGALPAALRLPGLLDCAPPLDPFRF